jgi:hypothetical protein
MAILFIVKKKNEIYPPIFDQNFLKQVRKEKTLER